MCSAVFKFLVYPSSRPPLVHRGWANIDPEQSTGNKRSSDEILSYVQGYALYLELKDVM